MRHDRTRRNQIVRSDATAAVDVPFGGEDADIDEALLATARELLDRASHLFVSEAHRTSDGHINLDVLVWFEDYRELCRRAEDWW